jgi:hypothetical protein
MSIAPFHSGPIGALAPKLNKRLLDEQNVTDVVDR